MPPFSYPVLDRHNIGFLKLLVSTCPIHSTAGTWPCLRCLEADGPSTLDGSQTWGTLTIPMIQHRSLAPTFSSKIVGSVCHCPSTDIRLLIFMLFLVHYAISSFQIPYTAPLRNGAAQNKFTSNLFYALPFSCPLFSSVLLLISYWFSVPSSYLLQL